MLPSKPVVPDIRREQHAKDLNGYDHVQLVVAIEGFWIVEALEIAVAEPGSREAIQRIIRNRMHLFDRTQSKGKDVLWELDLFRRLKYKGADVRLAEPDLILQLGGGLGDFTPTYLKEGLSKVDAMAF